MQQMAELDTTPVAGPGGAWLAQTLTALRSELEGLQPRLASRVEALRGGSLARSQGVWLNAAAACPVPREVLLEVAEALWDPHVTLERGADARTRALSALWQAQITGFCAGYAEGQGTLLLGHTATHVLLALGRTLSSEQPGIAIAHGDVDHKASYALSGLPGWRERSLVPYSEAGFYDRRSLAQLPADSVLLLNVLHHMYGTLQHDALASTPLHVPIILDLSQALCVLPPSHLTGFLRRATGAVFNAGKAFSPSSLGVLWLRDTALARRVLDVNPELAGSVSGLAIKTLASSLRYLQAALDDDWHRYVTALTRYTLARLSALEHVSIIGCGSFEAHTSRLGIVSLTVEGMSPAELGVYLDAQGFAVRADGHCTADGAVTGEYDCVRISLLPHVTPEHIDDLIDALRACA
jgi:selenocysteine lyase/cysteine desulfurase